MTADDIEQNIWAGFVIVGVGVLLPMALMLAPIWVPLLVIGKCARRSQRITRWLNL